MAEPTEGTNKDVFETVLENNEEINGNGSSHIVTSNNNQKTMAEVASGVVSGQASGNTITGNEAPANDIQQIEDPSENKATPGAENGIDPSSQKVMNAAERNAQAGYGSPEASAERAAELEAEKKKDENSEVKNADEEQPVKEEPVKEEPQEQPQEDAQSTPGSDFKGQTYSEYMDENTKSNLSYMGHTLADIGIATLDAASHALEAKEKQYGALVDLATAGLTGKPMTIASQALTSTVSGLGAAKKAMDDIGVQSLGLKPGMDPEKMRDKLAIKGAAYYRDRDRANLAQKFIAKTYADAINQYARGKNVTELSDEDIANIEGAIDKVMGKDWGRVQTKNKSEWTLEDRAFNAAYESMEKGLRKQSRANKKKAMEAEAEFNKPENLLKEYTAGTLTDPKHQRRLLRNLRDLERAGTLDSLPNGRATLAKLEAAYNPQLTKPEDLLTRYSGKEFVSPRERRRLKNWLMDLSVAGDLDRYPGAREALKEISWQNWVKGLQDDVKRKHTSLGQDWIDHSRKKLAKRVDFNDLYAAMDDPDKLRSLLKKRKTRTAAVGFARMTTAINTDDTLRATYPLKDDEVKLGYAIYGALWGVPAPQVIPQTTTPVPNQTTSSAPTTTNPAASPAPAMGAAGTPVSTKVNPGANLIGAVGTPVTDSDELLDPFDSSFVPRNDAKFRNRYRQAFLNPKTPLTDRQLQAAKLNYAIAVAKGEGWHDEAERLRKYRDILLDDNATVDFQVPDQILGEKGGFKHRSYPTELINYFDEYEKNKAAAQSDEGKARANLSRDYDELMENALLTSENKFNFRNILSRFSSNDKQDLQSLRNAVNTEYLKASDVLKRLKGDVESGNDPEHLKKIEALGKYINNLSTLDSTLSKKMNEKLQKPIDEAQKDEIEATFGRGFDDDMDPEKGDEYRDKVDMELERLKGLGRFNGKEDAKRIYKNIFDKLVKTVFPTGESKRIRDEDIAKILDDPEDPRRKDVLGYLHQLGALSERIPRTERGNAYVDYYAPYTAEKRKPITKVNPEKKMSADEVKDETVTEVPSETNDQNDSLDSKVAEFLNNNKGWFGAKDPTNPILRGRLLKQLIKTFGEDKKQELERIYDKHSNPNHKITEKIDQALTDLGNAVFKTKAGKKRTLNDIANYKKVKDFETFEASVKNLKREDGQEMPSSATLKQFWDKFTAEKAQTASEEPPKGINANPETEASLIEEAEKPDLKESAGRTIGSHKNVEVLNEGTDEYYGNYIEFKTEEGEPKVLVNGQIVPGTFKEYIGKTYRGKLDENKRKGYALMNNWVKPEDFDKAIKQAEKTWRSSKNGPDVLKQQYAYFSEQCDMIAPKARDHYEQTSPEGLKEFLNQQKAEGKNVNETTSLSAYRNFYKNYSQLKAIEAVLNAHGIKIT